MKWSFIDLLIECCLLFINLLLKYLLLNLSYLFHCIIWQYLPCIVFFSYCNFIIAYKKQNFYLYPAYAISISVAYLTWLMMKFIITKYLYWTHAINFVRSKSLRNTCDKNRLVLNLYSAKLLYWSYLAQTTVTLILDNTFQKV